MSKLFEMDQNRYEKCVIHIQVHSGVDVKFYLFFLPRYRKMWLHRDKYIHNIDLIITNAVKLKRLLTILVITQ